ncbi:MAG: zinc-ribbon domain-containing protein [Gemmataceae bacterium]|nr:zinc-ribbon domain-containing protein [Gemmataceae bacterium]
MTIKFGCPGCKKALNVPDNMAGRRGKCPHCGVGFAIPGGKRPAAAPVSNDPFGSLDEPASNGETYSPRRKKKRFSCMGCLAGCLLLVVGLPAMAVGGTFLAVKMKWLDSNKMTDYLAQHGITLPEQGTRSTKPEDNSTKANTGPENTGKETTTKKEDPKVNFTEAHFFPDNSIAIGAINFDALTGNKTYERFKEELGKANIDFEKNSDAYFKAVLAFQFAAVKRVVFVGKASEEVLIVRPRNPVTIDEVRARKTGDYKESKIGRFVLHEEKTDAFCLVDENMLIVGPPAALRKILERDKPAELVADLDAAYKLMNPAKAIGMAFIPADFLKAIAGSVPGGLPWKPPAEFEQSKAALLHVDFANGVEVTATAMAKDDAAAMALQKALDKQVAKLKEDLDTIKKDKAEEPEGALAKKLEEVVAVLKIEMSGANVNATLALNQMLAFDVVDIVKKVFFTKPAQ